MLEFAQTDVEQIRQLALDPTPANFQSIQARLERFVAGLSKVITNPEALTGGEAASMRLFLEGLPRDMARLGTLMRSPLDFYEGLQSLRTAHFGAYERSGEMRSLEPTPFSRTTLHL